MRSAGVCAVVFALASSVLAGCIVDDETPPEDLSEADESPGDQDLELEEDDPGERYVLGVTPVYWDYTDLTVLIVPPMHGQVDPDQVHPHDSLFLKAVEDSITHWQEVVDEHGSAELRGNLTFEVYVLGRDVFMPDDVDPVDILIVHPPGGRLEAAGQKSLLGGFAYRNPEACVIGNLVHPLLEYNWLFMVSAHEFGHCLGLGHPLGMKPWNDLMSYTERNLPPGEELPDLECVSNFDLMGVHEAFAHVFDKEGESAVSITESEYEIYGCADRFLPDRSDADRTMLEGETP